MDEKYTEYCVSVRQTPGMRLKQAAVLLLTIAAVFLAVMVHWIFFLAVLAGCVFCYLAYMSADLEYETIYVDGSLEICAIYRKMRRKRKFLCELKNMSGYHIGRKEEAVRLGAVTRDFSSHRDVDDCCVMKIENHVVCFEPGEELINILERQYKTLKV
ncbi:MAG TPA: hypothetical protein DD414_03305 [Lachnospiraceae bacterium]|nr:hypothetical protein [Lachnospiraceae bacterium]